MKKARIPANLRKRVAKDAKYRCGYCLTSQEITGARMEIDYIIPEVEGGETKEENLWLACRSPPIPFQPSLIGAICEGC